MLALAAGPSAQAHSLPTAVENPAGHYQGFYDSSVTGQIATFTMDVAPVSDAAPRRAAALGRAP